MKPSKRNPLPQHLVDEWHPTKNGDLKPEDVTASKAKKVWWLSLECGHEWDARIDHRCRTGSGCAYCKGKRVLAGFNDLLTLYPDIAVEWDYSKNSFQPNEVRSFSNKKAWWICSLGHSWNDEINRRTGRGNGCPYCSGRRVLAGFNDLQTTDPKLALEYDNLSNTLRSNEVTRSSGRHAWWIGECSHSWYSKIANRVHLGRGCPYCSGQKTLKGFNDLESQRPDVAKEWDYAKNSKKPSEVTKSAEYRAFWLCPENHSYRARVAHRTHGTGCPQCNTGRLSKGVNDLESRRPEVAKEWDYAKNSKKPSEVTVGSDYNAWWICAKSHSYQAPVHNRTRKAPTGCGYCNQGRFLRGFNDILTKSPEVVYEWSTENKESPNEVHFNSVERYAWVCSSKEHKYFMSPRSRYHGGACPSCTRHGTSRGEKSLFDYIASIVGTDNVVANSRKVISPYELDIYLPNLNLAIEYNGDYWHSNEVISKRTGMSADEYHLNKVEKCKELGITLVFVWDSQWTTYRSEIEGTIRSLVLGEIESPEVLSMFTLSSPSTTKQGEGFERG